MLGSPQKSQYSTGKTRIPFKIGWLGVHQFFWKIRGYFRGAYAARQPKTARFCGGRRVVNLPHPPRFLSLIWWIYWILVIFGFLLRCVRGGGGGRFGTLLLNISSTYHEQLCSRKAPRPPPHDVFRWSW